MIFRFLLPSLAMRPNSKCDAITNTPCDRCLNVFLIHVEFYSSNPIAINQLTMGKRKFLQWQPAAYHIADSF